MTRCNQIGSLSRNIKRAFTVAMLLYSGETQAHESQYKYRIHRSLIKETLDTNLPLAFDHIGSKVEKRNVLTEINAVIEDLALNIRPSNQDWTTLESDLFFDQGQIVMELKNLNFVGKGNMVDQSSGQVEEVQIISEIDLCQLVLTPEQEVTEDGLVHPKIEITEVVFQLKKDNLIVNSRGELPMYKEHQYEQHLKTWIMNHASQFEKDFKIAMQASEREIMSSFAFKKDLKHGAKIHSTMGETINLEGDHMIIQYSNDIEADNQAEINEVKQNLRKIESQFSNEAVDMKDIQAVIDENYFNYGMLHEFLTAETFSLTEALVNWWPEDFYGGSSVIRPLMSAGIWQAFFPNLQWMDKQTQIDLRCGTGKKFLGEGGLKQNVQSTFKFKEGNQVDMDIHFGCTMYTFEKEAAGNPLGQIYELFSAISIDKEDPRWKEQRSVFASFNLNTEFVFGRNAIGFDHPILESLGTLTGLNSVMDNYKQAKQSTPFVYAKIVDFKPTLTELKMWTEGKEDEAEEKNFNDLFNDIKGLSEKPELQLIKTIFNQGIPVAPFPSVERCLGFIPEDSNLIIHDGYAVVSYDYKVIYSDHKCLFHMKETLAEKEKRLLDETPLNQRAPMEAMDLLQKKIKNAIDKEVYKYTGVIPSLVGQGETIDINSVFEGVKPFLGDTEKAKQKLAEGLATASQFARDNKENIEKATDFAKTLSGFFTG